MSSTPTFMFLLHNLRYRWRVLFYTDILYTVYIQRIFYTLSSTAGARCHKICWVIVWVLESGCSGVGEGRTSDKPSGKGWDCQSLLCWAPEVLQSVWQIVRDCTLTQEKRTTIPFHKKLCSCCGIARYSHCHFWSHSTQPRRELG